MGFSGMNALLLFLLRLAVTDVSLYNFVAGELKRSAVDADERAGKCHFSRMGIFRM